MDNRKYLPFILIGAVALFLIISLSSSLFFKLGPAERAVAFYTLSGKLDKSNIITPGWHIKAPWTTIYTYDVSEKSIDQTLNVQDKNGLSISVDVTVRFSPMKDKIGDIQETFKGDYIDVLVIPEVRSSARQVIARYAAEEIYSTKREEVKLAIRNEMEQTLGSPQNNIEMRTLLIRAVFLPDQIKNAIEMKLQQEQEALAYEFKLKKEESEAERKRIAAEGEAQANKIVNSSLTPELLKMRGIEATQELANSQNAKVVIVGNSKDGLPLILGDN